MGVVVTLCRCIEQTGITCALLSSLMMSAVSLLLVALHDAHETQFSQKYPVTATTDKSWANDAVVLGNVVKSEANWMRR